MTCSASNVVPPSLAPAVPWLTLLLATSLLGCYRKEEPSTSRFTPAEPVMIAASTVEGSTPVFVALEKGFFRAEGLNASLSILPTGQLALEEMLAGRANFATVGDTPFVRAVVEGKSLRAIATISENNYANAIVARRDRGIA